MTATEFKTLCETNWKLVCAYVHYNGEHRDALTEEDYKVCFELANGFGTVKAAYAKRLGFYGDWSHFRDSDEYAVNRVADYLKLVVQAR